MPIEVVASLSGSDLQFLAELRGGISAREYARRHSYSYAWAEWKSKEIRRKLGVHTLGEAIQMSEGASEGVGKADFARLESLVGKLGDALEDLIRAKPADQPAAQQQVAQRELDAKDHAKALGLDMKDVEAMLGEKDYARFKANQDRLDKERAEAEGDGEPQRDGLGGILNLARGNKE